VRVTVNGDPRETREGAVVADLLPADCRGSAAAVNGAVVPRARLTETLLREGDVVEIVTAVQGG